MECSSVLLFPQKNITFQTLISFRKTVHKLLSYTKKALFKGPVMISRAESHAMEMVPSTH